MSVRGYSAATILGGILLAGPAYASGPAGSGLAATAENAIDDAANPAGLPRQAVSEWDGEIVGITSQYRDNISTSGSLSHGISGSGNFAIPAVYYARPWKEHVGVGVSLSVPGGIGSNPGDATIGRYLLEKWSLGYGSLAPAIGYQVNRQWAVGFSLNLNYASYEYTNAVFNGVGQPDGQMTLSGSDFGVGYRLGALYELSPVTRFGLVYRSSTTSSFSDTPEFTGLSPQRQAVLEKLGILTQPVGLESRFPQAVIAGLFHEYPNRVTATLDLGWVNFSQFGLTELTLGSNSLEASDGHYQDMWAGSGGLSYPLSDRWKLQFGAAYVSSGLSDSNRTWALRLDRIWGVGAGATYFWHGGRSLAANLTYYDLGRAPVTADVPGVGSLSASYSTNYAIALKISLRWQRSPPAQ